MKMPTLTTASLLSTSSPATMAGVSTTDGAAAQILLASVPGFTFDRAADASTTVQPSFAEAGLYSSPLSGMRLESSSSFSIVFGTLIVGLVLVRHFIARARSGPLDQLS